MPICSPWMPATADSSGRLDARARLDGTGRTGRKRRRGSEVLLDGRPIITRRKGIYLLPNLLTTCGLFAGFYSIVASIDGNFQLTAWAIFAAMLFDSLDGRVARLTSTSSEFGKEYDSLADMVSFEIGRAHV